MLNFSLKSPPYYHLTRFFSLCACEAIHIFSFSFSFLFLLFSFAILIFFLDERVFFSDFTRPSLLIHLFCTSLSSSVQSSDDVRSLQFEHQRLPAPSTRAGTPQQFEKRSLFISMIFPFFLLCVP